MWMMILPVVKSIGQTLIFTNVGRLILIGIALFSAWQVDRYWQRQKGAQKVVERSIQQGKKANDRNAEIRKKAKEPGAAERLLRDPATCRDC